MMRVTVRFLAAFLAAAWGAGAGSPPARAAGGMCPMGGTMVMAGTDRERTLAWAGAKARVEVSDSGADDWSVLAFSVADEGVAVLVEPGQVFFGVAGRGGETYPRDLERAFGPNLAKLRAAVAGTLAELAAAGVVKIETAEIPVIAAAAGLGVLEKGAGGWALTTRDCQAVDLPASGL